MSDHGESIDVALQICFGILGVVGVLAAIAGISYETSLGAFIYRRLRSSPDQRMSAACSTYRYWLTDDRLRRRIGTPVGRSFSTLHATSHMASNYSRGHEVTPAKEREDV